MASPAALIAAGCLKINAVFSRKNSHKSNFCDLSLLCHHLHFDEIAHVVVVVFCCWGHAFALR